MVPGATWTTSAPTTSLTSSPTSVSSPSSCSSRLCRVFDIPFLEAKKVTDTIEIRQDSEETTLEELLPLQPSPSGVQGRSTRISGSTPSDSKGQSPTPGSTPPGVIITPKPVAHYMALERGKKGDLVTSWSDSADFTAVSDHGFVKIDFLGIRGLAKHDYACKLIEKRHGIKLDLNKLCPSQSVSRR